MLMTITSATVTILLSTAIMVLTTVISKKINEDREKSSPFECGFDPKNSARLPFSSRFFLIAVIFMIFDVEIALLLPMPITMMTSNIKSWMIVSSVFLLILIIGLYHEWNQGSLEWSN
uniref:NADH-ubiquinone oxidoreductase chain 3 n=1 Tax=Microcerotermes sp. 1 MLW-2023a TaxID=3077003 RepID=A0AA97IT72_9NEOP|nr:NADH dehydrogenase subunit 3 [Microcerotermes sp. 1 MLW-2023a]WNL53997.1 NADH dehydrogenase subunit 3 [Microcerotermes sp. 1 MLW-2023a]WNL54153.1 NADH dehydrogenase subunit 3 [Microcerotermes sp. 1 MLW-2023a]WNL54192.1 NADH dehydrogenase subunit 3 [Microcerotermes sp. 1 MLW-2023a]WNL54218.1 NADH dehydrogenase subunit 3 [Microcerotermes sp. 1 MLW-2023a]